MAKNKKTKTLRIKFLPEKRGKFFKNLTKSSHYSEKELAKLVGINRRSYYDWKKGRSSPPLKTVLFLSKKFEVSLPEKKEILVKRWQKEKSKSAKIGGQASLKKYGSPGTKEGRSRGGRTALEKLRKEGIILKRKKFFRPKHSAKLAEFVGIILGDGGLSKDQVKIYLNSEKDYEYSNFVVSLANTLFKTRFRKIKRNKYHVLVIYDSGINLVEFLLSIGLKQGNKVKNQVDVPKWIKKKSSLLSSLSQGTNGYRRRYLYSSVSCK
jgi:DNA-binding XRE family transcriptional regulator